MSRGRRLLTLKEVWTEILPAADLALVVASMDEEARAVWNRPPLAVTWMPQRPAFELHPPASSSTLGPRALPLAEEVARRIMPQLQQRVQSADSDGDDRLRDHAAPKAPRSTPKPRHLDQSAHWAHFVGNR